MFHGMQELENHRSASQPLRLSRRRDKPLGYSLTTGKSGIQQSQAAAPVFTDLGTLLEREPDPWLSYSHPHPTVHPNYHPSFTITLSQAYSSEVKDTVFNGSGKIKNKKKETGTFRLQPVKPQK